MSKDELANLARAHHLPATARLIERFHAPDLFARDFARDVRLDAPPHTEAVMDPALAYCYFNMDDPIVGGYTPDKIALRRAIVMAFNTKDLIDVWYQGQAVRATQPIPPPVAGHSAGFDANIKYDPATAKALLDRFAPTSGDTA